MSHHHELHQDLSQGPQPRPRHRRDQEAVGRYRRQGPARHVGYLPHHQSRRVNFKNFVPKGEEGGTFVCLIQSLSRLFFLLNRNETKAWGLHQVTPPYSIS